MAQALAIVGLALAARTGTGQGAAVDIGATRSAARLQLELTAISGANASLVVTLETSADGATGWRAVDAWDALTAVDKVERNFAGLSRFVRVSWVLTGTGPSATFTVYGDAHQLFLTIGSLNGAQVPTKAIASVPKTVVAGALIDASQDGEDAMASSFTLPIVSVGPSMTKRLAAIAAYHVMSFRGFQPQGTDELFIKNHDDAQAWLMRVSQAKLRPPGIVDSAPTTYEGGAAVVTNASRGW